MIFNEKQVNNKKNIVDSLNKHFVNISSYSDVNTVDNSQFLRLKTYVDSKLHPSTQFVVKEITPFKVMKIVKSIKNTKIVGIDDILSRVFKLATDALSIPIASIINNSIKQNIFPEELKHAKVVPVYKKGVVDDPHNYRPISVLPCISKVFEKHICNQLQEFFNKTNILHSTQSGFRKGHSCQTALLHLVNKWAT